ncbi:MAG TPA: hypothetical protein VMA83_11070 [Solirubrobacteraceae bacterium]|nr:hypothetical protein [Solirubrobacteraceae bacterium]
MGGKCRATLGLTWAFAALVLLAGASSAAAITRMQADKIAMKVLAPQRIDAANGVVLLGLPRPLSASDDVNQAKPGTSQVRTLGKREWLFWLDPAYGERFSHASTILLLDNRTGKVAAKQKIEWWPLVDGKPAAFYTSEKERESGADKRFRVYANLPASKFSRATRAARGNAIRVSHAPIAHASNTYSDSCLVLAGNLDDFPDDFTNIATYFGDLGVEGFRMPSTEDLGAFIKKLPSKCKDVIIYLSGHEGHEGGIIAPAKVKRKTITQVNGKHVFGWEEKVEDQIITVRSITEAIKSNAARTFKVIVDACYSGLVIAAIEKAKLANALVAAASSGSTESSWAFSHGGFTEGLIEGMKEGETTAKSDMSGADPIARLIEEGTKHPHGVFSGRWKTYSSLPALTTKPPAYKCGKEVTLYDNTNTEFVEDVGTEMEKESSFTTGPTTYCLVSVFNYHWNYGKGSASVGTIALKYPGGEIGPWQAEDSPGEEVPTAYWTANVYSEAEPILIKGTYTCWDSEYVTWSANEKSERHGFCKVTGRVLEPVE